MEQIKPLKEMAPRERASYIFDYYKFHILAVIVILFAAGSLIHHYAARKTPVANLIMLNAAKMDTAPIEDSFDDFLTANGKDPKKEGVVVNASLIVRWNDPATYQEQMTLQMLVATRSYNLLFCDRDIFDVYAAQPAFRDLEEFVPEDVLATYEQNLLYAEIPDTGRRYICGIRLTPENNAWLADTGAYESCCLGVLIGDSDDDTTRSLLAYLLR